MELYLTVSGEKRKTQYACKKVGGHYPFPTVLMETIKNGFVPRRVLLK